MVIDLAGAIHAMLRLAYSYLNLTELWTIG
jgi:hypothetical protein